MAKEKLLVVVLLSFFASGDSGMLVPAEIDPDITVAPNAPYSFKVPIGHAQLVQFSCWGGPADAVLTLRTYAEHSDPLIFLSMGDSRPDLSHHDLSSFDQWREDAAGDHHLILKAVGPEGGVLGLVNNQHFATEEFYGILSIRCSYIIAFDAIFWDNLQSSSVCPVGTPQVALEHDELPRSDFVCSGHGRCDKHSNCECAAGWTGLACASEVYDLVATSQHHYEIEAGRGQYKYFRVRIPPSFKGGFLEVNVSADAPLVVLVSGREKGLPTKSSFDLSNFDDWLQRSCCPYVSRLQFRVSSPLGVDLPKRLLTENAPLPAEQGRFQPPVRGARAPMGRPLQLPMVSCPTISPGWQDQSCHTPKFAACESSCSTCIVCNKTTAVEDTCALACSSCLGPGCNDVLGNCAASVGCMGNDAHECEAKCTNCMACLDSNDPACEHCRCCGICLPLAAKCGLLATAFDDVSYVHVAVFNHRRLHSGRPVVRGVLDLGLREEPGFVQPTQPSSWIAALYDRFQNVQDLESTQRTRYPDGEQFLYHFNLNRSGELQKEVRIFSQRLTLLHVVNAGEVKEIQLSFSSGADITHVLASSVAAPKTLFDFDQVFSQLHGKAHIAMLGKSDIWCALFAGNDDASVVVTVSSVGPPSAGAAAASPMVFILLCIFTLLCGLIVSGSIYSGLKKPAERNTAIVEPENSISERLASLVRPPSHRTQSTTERSQGRSLQGYVSSSSDFMDPSVEEQYLFRGGFGDDGM